MGGCLKVEELHCYTGNSSPSLADWGVKIQNVLWTLPLSLAYITFLSLL